MLGWHPSGLRGLQDDRGIEQHRCQRGEEKSRDHCSTYAPVQWLSSASRTVRVIPQDDLPPAMLLCERVCTRCGGWQTAGGRRLWPALRSIRRLAITLG